MEPLVLKLVVMLVAVLVGAAIAVYGLYLFQRAMFGSSEMLIQAPGVKAKLTNMAPGTVIALIGAAVIVFALRSGGTFETSDSGTSYFERWLSNSAAIKATDSYDSVRDKVMKSDFRLARNIVLERKMTLGEIAEKAYGDPKFFRLIVVFNLDSGPPFDLDKAKVATEVEQGKLIQYFVPQWQQTRLQVADSAIRLAYEKLLARTATGALDLEKQRGLELYFRDSFGYELGYKTVQMQKGDLLNPIIMKYYGDPRYGSLINRFNPGAVSADGKNVLQSGPMMLPVFLNVPLLNDAGENVGD
jgi:hypothetical protein